ncbi:apicoplast calcium binding protein 1 [Plasmodium gonderi]|uniref:Apicoplast calcium binding protein 1 n=1 Tax=Plasmodium gonderi TaxID=77519 RepID=A0A1Y1JKW2_PLAGO|nr:apicoplast calcium binding protein 1 [Plasmodium gonderi]GAW82268.1 apicoplast calcium binding protein 1 [Plasmodium gonderi]
MKLLKFSFMQYDGLVTHVVVCASLIALFFLNENFIRKKNDFFSMDVSSKKVCDFLHKNIYKLEKLYICSDSFTHNKFFHNDWKSLRESHMVPGNFEKMGNTLERGKLQSVERNLDKRQGDRDGIRQRNDVRQMNGVDNKKETPEKDYDNSARGESDNHRDNTFNFTLDTNNSALNEHILKKSKMVFQKLDSNKNNFIDFNEFKRNVNILSKIRNINKKILNYLFELFDVNNDKKINYIEFLHLNSYDFNYIKLIQILFDGESVVEKSAIHDYLEIYFSEFLDSIVVDMQNKHFSIQRNNFIHTIVKNFFKNTKNMWDLNNDNKLQLEEFQNFQLLLLVEIDHLLNFMHLDLNFDGHIDISELLFYINHDGTVYKKLSIYLESTSKGSRNSHDKKDEQHINMSDASQRENLFNYVQETLKVENSLVQNVKLLFYSFDVNNDLLLDLEEYKNQMTTLSVLDLTPEIIFSS